MTVTGKTDNMISVMWTESQTAQSYLIMLVDANGNVVEAIEAPAGVSTYDFNALNPDTQYTAIITSNEQGGTTFPVGQVTDRTNPTGKDLFLLC